MAINLENVFSIHDDALLMRGKRSSVLASNIANADTPNYKARDFDFKALMTKATDNGTQMTMSKTHDSHIAMPVEGQNGLSQHLKYRNPLHASLDGNTVDSHVEQAMFAENAIQFQSSFTFLNGKVRSLMNAIKGE